MNDKTIGLIKKYNVIKLSNSQKKIDAIVLEFDDPIARVGILSWASEMNEKGYFSCARDVLKKLELFGGDYSTTRIGAVDYFAEVLRLKTENDKLKEQNKELLYFLDEYIAKIEEEYDVDGDTPSVPTPYWWAVSLKNKINNIPITPKTIPIKTPKAR